MRKITESQKLWNCDAVVDVKNITVTVPDDVYRAARIAAAERNASVSDLAREFLASVSNAEAEFDRLAAQQRRIAGELAHFSARTGCPAPICTTARFLDTNVLLYAVSNYPQEADKAERAFGILHDRDLGD